MKYMKFKIILKYIVINHMFLKIILNKMRTVLLEVSNIVIYIKI